jgi:hypothetical protein
VPSPFSPYHSLLSSSITDIDELLLVFTVALELTLHAFHHGWCFLKIPPILFPSALSHPGAHNMPVVVGAHILSLSLGVNVVP